MAAGTTKLDNHTIKHVSSELDRLNTETASVLAQALRRLDVRQKRIEERQREMAGAVSAAQNKLHRVQTGASQASAQLQRNKDAFDARRSRPQSGKPMPSCFDWSPA